MKKLEFFEVNFGELQIHPLMTAKCFSSFHSAYTYASDLQIKLREHLLERVNYEFVSYDECIRLEANHSDGYLLVIFRNSYRHLEVYEIKIIRHIYQLED